MEVIIKAKNISKRVAVSETDSLNSLKEVFSKSTGTSLPKRAGFQNKFGIDLSPNVTLQQAGIISGDIIFIRKTRENYLARISVLSVILLFFILGVFGLTLAYKINKVHPFDYAMVFDAGSTHTEMMLYNWQADKFRGTGIVTEIHSCYIEGGIGEVLRSNPRNASNYFDKCLQEGLNLIPEERRSRSPIFLAATAGMRLLRLEDPATAQQVMGNVSRLLGSTGMLFEERSVRIITGKEEAVSGWVSANYLLHFLHPIRQDTVGTLDLGGASTQITFVENEDSTNVPDALLKLYGEEYDVIAMSNLCFGQEQIYKRYLATLIEEHLKKDNSNETIGNVTISSPCNNDGWSITMDLAELQGPCTESIPFQLSMDASITVVGGFNNEVCQRNIRQLLDTKKCRKKYTADRCFYKPPEYDAHTKFVATAGFYYTVSNMQLNGMNSTLHEFETAGKRFCQKSWREIALRVNDNDTAAIINRLYRLCFNTRYNLLLLTEGYGFNNETWSNIAFANKVNGTGIGWPLGFAIRSTNYIPEDGKIDHFPTDAFASLLFVFALIIGACSTLIIAKVLMTLRLRNNSVAPISEKEEIKVEKV